MSLRLAIVGILTVAIVVLVAAIRPPEGQYNTGLSREKFWQVKLGAPASYDVVLAGDSRTLCDLQPTAMQAVLGQRVLNYGFNLVALTPEYLRAAAQKLDPNGARILLVGVTPRSLTPLNVQLSGYTEEKSRSIDERFFNKHLNLIDYSLRPMSIPTMLKQLATGRSSHKDFFVDGWMAVSLSPPDSTQDLGVYSRVFLNNPVSRGMVDSVITTFGELSARGIRVYLIRFPTTPAILAHEERSGFLEQDFIVRAAAQGATWLPSPAGSFVITDGSHIDAKDVPAYSTRVAQALQRATSGVSPR
jgi:hypothetical protein